MVTRFISSPPAGQHLETVRQFQELEGYLGQVETRIFPQAAVYLAQDMTLADGWAPIVPEDGFGTIPLGTYALTVICTAVGTNAQAECQFRVVEDGSTLISGKVVTVGNERLGVSRMLIIPQGVGFEIQARGLHCSLIDMEIVLVRVGAAQ